MYQTLPVDGEAGVSMQNRPVCPSAYLASPHASQSAKYAPLISVHVRHAQSGARDGAEPAEVDAADACKREVASADDEDEDEEEDEEEDSIVMSSSSVLSASPLAPPSP